MPQGSTTTICISCKAVISVATKTCKFCQSGQPRKQRLAKKLRKFEAKKEAWLQNQKRNKTTTHVIDEASVLVEKLHTLGHRAVMFLAKPGKKPATWFTHVIHSKWQLSDQGVKCLDRMKALYEVLVIGWTSQETSISPAIQSSTSPTIQSSTSPAIQSSASPAIQSSISPAIQSSLSPAIQSSTSPAIQSSTSPAIQFSISTAIQSSTSPAIQFSTSPAIQYSTSPAIQSSIRPAIQSSISPAIQSSTSPVIQSSTSPAIQSSTSSAIQSSIRLAIQSSTSPAIQSSTSPAIQFSTSPAIQSSTGPAIQSSISPAIQSSTGPAIQSSISPAIQSSTSPAIQPTTCPGTACVHTRTAAAKRNQEILQKKKQKRRNKDELSSGGRAPLQIAVIRVDLPSGGEKCFSAEEMDLLMCKVEVKMQPIAERATNGTGRVGALFYVWEDMASAMGGKGEHKELTSSTQTPSVPKYLSK